MVPARETERPTAGSPAPPSGREPAAPARRGSRLSVGQKLAAVLALPLLATAALPAVVLGTLAGDQASARRAREALDQAARGRELHLAALEHRDALRDLLTARGTRGDLDAAAARLERAAGSYLHGAAPGDDGLAEARLAGAAVLRGTALAIEAAEAAGPRAAVRTAFEDAYAREVVPPLEDAARREGERARAALASAQQLSRRRLALGAWASLASILLALTPALIFARQLARAVRRLRAAAQRIGEGELPGPLGAEEGELGELAEAMGQMAARIDATRDRERLIATAEARVQALEEGRADLEARVEERTSALARANADLAENLHRLSEAQQKLMVSDRLAAIGQLASAVAHEVNNPISSVASNLAFAAEEVRILAGELRAGGRPIDAGREAEIASALGDAREAAFRVARIVRDLGTIARAEVEPMAPVDLRQAVEAAVNVGHAALKHCARVERHLGDVPAVLATTSHLAQVFLPILLLAGRSIAARGPGSRGVVRIATWTDPEGPAIAEVSDDGAGMTPEAMAHLFDPFGPLQPSGPESGLGLAVAHGIASSLGGSIEVRSTVGAGTTVRLTLPPALPAEGAAETLRSAPGGRAAAVH